MLLKTNGYSMFPNIKQGEFLEIILNLDNIQIGDVLVFYDVYFKKIIAHRILAMYQEYFICKGDNFEYLDPPVNIDQVIGIASNKYLNLNYEYTITFNDLNSLKKNVLISTSKKIFDRYNEKIFDIPIQYNSDINYIISNDLIFKIPFKSIYYTNID